jgi:hypothetical protein
LRSRTIPAGYLQTLFVIGLICAVIVIRTYPTALKPDWHFWLLGAAFLLVEFKSITELALLFGTTWFVNALAISGVLAMALGANLIVLRSRKIHLGWAYAFLFGSLLLDMFISLEMLSSLPNLLKAASSIALLSLPMFFAGLIFSESLRRAKNTAGPLASNFSGSAAGGFLEYSSLVWGINGLYWLALGLYGLSFLIARIRRMC